MKLHVCDTCYVKQNLIKRPNFFRAKRTFTFSGHSKKAVNAASLKTKELSESYG